jgi:type IV secretory pathway VirB10-like protein
MNLAKNTLRGLACVAVWIAALGPRTGVAETGNETPLLNEGAGADAYFHGGARPYIRGDAEQARSILEEGLMFHPDDPKINRLIQLLEEQREPPPQHEQGEEDPEDQEPEEGEEDQPQETDPESDPGEEEEQDAQPEPNDAEPDGTESEDVSDLDPGKMTDEEAEMILDDMLQQEERSRSDSKLRFGPAVPVDKDW